MSQENILITSVGRKVSLVDSITKAGSKYGVKVFATDITQDAVALYFADEFFISLLRTDINYLDNLIEICINKNIRYLLPTSDEELLFFSTKKQELLGAGITLIASDLTTLHTCISKTSFADFCTKEKLLQPYSYEGLEQASFPLVIKNEYSSAGRGVSIVKDLSSAKSTIKALGNQNFLLQEFVTLPEFSIDAYFNKSYELIAALPRTRDKVLLGESVITSSQDVPQLVELVDLIGSKLNFWGHITIQAFFDGQDYKLVEINPRFGGASSLSFSCGVNSPLWLVEEIAGAELTQQKIKFNRQLMRYSADFIREI